MVMKIFFAGSIRGGGNYQGMYREILGFLKTYGDILSEHQEYDSAPDNKGLTGDAAIYARDTGWIRDADVLIAEVSQPSCGVGYEIAYAESRGIPVLALYYRGIGPQYDPSMPFMGQRPLAGKPGVLVTTVAGAGHEKTMEILSMCMGESHRMNIIDKIAVPIGMNDVADMPEVMKLAEEAGKKLGSALKNR